MGEPRLLAQEKVHVDNERVIVKEVRFAPGAETGWHRHELDYVVVMQTTGKLLFETKEGNKTGDLKSGQPFFGRAGVEHNLVNVNEYEFVLIEIWIRS